jgi:RNA-binding protein
MLSKQQIRDFRAEAHHLKPELLIGKEGLNEAFLVSLSEAFNTKELLKVKMLDTCPQGRKAITEKLSSLDEITLVQNIGHTYILYKKMEEPEKKDEKPARQPFKKPFRKTGGPRSA